ncbi:hypothetical protein HY57_11355 [Dyella japonica A8]|uniref:CN hydrolase domain-containing protein n=1 Tax=Dyella japonica A8 TaxID=1217721 RepID=A0A075K0G2_9GAMM|nr:hypothetical protein HY57_11355 [Dyella japonica A8]
MRAPWAALAALAAYVAGGFNIWTYAHGHLGLPLPIILTFIATTAVVMSACTLLFRRLLLRGHVFAAALSLPAAWVAFEYINSHLSPHATFFNISYTQASVLPVIQLVAVTGLWGLSFLMLLVPTAASLQMWPHAAKRVRWSVAGLAVLALIATLAYGGWRLQQAPTSTVRIGLVSLEAHGWAVLPSEEGDARQARYVDALQRLINQGAKILLIPEGSFATGTATIPAFATLAIQNHVTIGAGIALHGNAPDARNMLTVFEPGTTSPATYSKHHLLRGLEQFVPGDSFTMLSGTPRIGLAICKDMDYQDIGQAYAARRAQLLLVPAFDFQVDGWLHSRMAIVRGVESGFAVARSARAGRLTLSDDRGRVVAEASSEQNDAELVGDLPLHDTTTLYSRLGDWFAWLDLAVLAGVLVVALLPRKRVA